MKKASLVILSVFLIFSSGCVRKEILDDVNLISAFGYDYVDEHKIKGTALIPVYEKEKTSNKTFTETSVISKDILEELQHKSSDPLVNGSLEIVVYGNKLAEKGILPITDTLLRDSSIGTRLFLTVVKGSAQELLEGQYGKQGNGIYLSNLIRQNIEQRDIPKTNLHKFLYAYYSDGSDPFLPYIQKMKDNVKIIGIALFDGDRMVDYIKGKDMFYFKILVDGYTEGTHSVRLNKNEYVAIKSIKTDRKFFLSGPKEHPQVTIEIKISGILREYSEKKATKKIKHKIEKEFEREMIKETKSLIKHLQSLKIDPIGIGDEAKSRYRNFDYKAFYDNYPNLDIKIKAKATITSSGIVE